MQHTTEHLTIKTYAEKGADDLEAAKERCLKKYRKEAMKIMREGGLLKRRNRTGDKRVSK